MPPLPAPAAVAPTRTSPAERRPEHELLLRCARLALAPDDAARIGRLVSAGLDWERVLSDAERHGLIGFLHRHLRPPLAVPAAALADLRARHRDAAHRSLRLAGELRRLLDALAADGIDALAYKGPALAMQAYGDLALRSFVDLDFLVRPDDAPRALALLAREGYEPALRMTPAQSAFFRRVDGDWQLVHRETGTLVELHCRVSSERFGMPLETEELMRRARPVPLGGTEIPAPAPDDALLIALVHGCKHRWKRLEWLTAAAELLRAGEVDLDAVLRRAERLRARRTALLGLALARRLLDAPLPASIVDRIDADAGLAALADEAERRIFAPGSPPVDGERGEDADEGEETAPNLLFNLRARDGALDRARFAWRWMTDPSPEDWAWRPLPDTLFPLYRVLRPVRLALRYGRRAVRPR